MTELVDTPYGVMSNDRRLISLSDLCASNGGVQTGPFGSQLHQADYVVDGMPIVTVEHLGDRRINGDEAPRVSSEDVARLQKYSLEEGDIVFSRVGSVDRCSLVTSNEAGWLFSGRCLRVRPKKTEVDSVFLSYFFRFDRFKDYIRAIAVGATMPSINTEIMRSVKVPLPPLVEQRAIAGVLGALDDKIESNRKLAGTLREYGQALLSQVMLQNSTFSPLRSVVASVARGVAPSYVEDSESPLVLNQRCIRNGRVELSAARRMSHRTVTPERLAQQGDVLVNSTGTGTLGRVARWNGNTVFVDGHVSVVKPDAEKFSPTVLAYLLLSCQTEIEELAEGSTGQTELSPKRLLDFQIAMPKAINAEKVEPELLDLELRGEKALQESDALEMLRDALLPELLSGRLRVKDAESMMENV